MVTSPKPHLRTLQHWGPSLPIRGQCRSKPPHHTNPRCGRRSCSARPSLSSMWTCPACPSATGTLALSALLQPVQPQAAPACCPGTSAPLDGWARPLQGGRPQWWTPSRTLHIVPDRHKVPFRTRSYFKNEKESRPRWLLVHSQTLGVNQCNPGPARGSRCGPARAYSSCPVSKVRAAPSLPALSVQRRRGPNTPGTGDHSSQSPTHCLGVDLGLTTCLRPAS